MTILVWQSSKYYVLASNNGWQTSYCNLNFAFLNPFCDRHDDKRRQNLIYLQRFATDCLELCLRAESKPYLHFYMLVSTKLSALQHILPSCVCFSQGLISKLFLLMYCSNSWHSLSINSWSWTSKGNLFYTLIDIYGFVPASVLFLSLLFKTYILLQIVVNFGF